MIQSMHVVFSRMVMLLSRFVCTDCILSIQCDKIDDFIIQD